MLCNHTSWSRTSSKTCSWLFGMRKKQTPTKSQKYKHTTKVFPFPNCLATTKNPGEHLKEKKHGFKSTDKNYKKMITFFKAYDATFKICQSLRRKTTFSRNNQNLVGISNRLSAISNSVGNTNSIF